MEASAQGMRTLWISLAVLGATALIQADVVALSGSVALLGDALHNAADALTAVPLGVAFVAGRRAPTRRYTYGYGRAEDLAGIAIVLTVAASSALAAYEAITRLMHPRHVYDLFAVAAAALISPGHGRRGARPAACHPAPDRRARSRRSPAPRRRRPAPDPCRPPAGIQRAAMSSPPQTYGHRAARLRFARITGWRLPSCDHPQRLMP
jgi:hypothetical protein